METQSAAVMQRVIRPLNGTRVVRLLGHVVVLVCTFWGASTLGPAASPPHTPSSSAQASDFGPARPGLVASHRSAGS